MNHQLSRRLTPTALFMLSLNSIIGSGWLFAPLFAAKIAGPASIISWLIGGFAAILIALTFAELSTMFPIAGGSARLPQLSHGTLASFILGWVGWLSSIILVPIEVQAVIQYAYLFFPSLMYEVNGFAKLTLHGYLLATMLMLSLCIINMVSYKGLVRFNFILFFFKFSIMIITVFAIFHTQFNPVNFSGLFSTMVTPNGWQTIFSAVATGGIVLAFNGFKSGVEMAGETKKLAIAIPLSTAGSVIACLLLYICLQICFIGALSPESIKDGWQNLSFSGDIGPLVGLTAALGLIILYKLLYANALISPYGAGLVYVTSTARILYAMGKIGFAPKFLSRLNKQKLPVAAIVANFIIGMFAFLPLPGLQEMMNFLVSAVVITYAVGPVALICFRVSLPYSHRPFRLRFAIGISLFAFYCCNLFCYWTGWATISKLMFTLLVGALLFFIGYVRGSVKISKTDLKTGYWVIFYLIGIISISYLGAFGGKNVIPFGWDFLVIGIFSMGILYWAVKTRQEISQEKLNLFLAGENITLEQPKTFQTESKVLA